jgi:translation initiation factor IF-3
MTPINERIRYSHVRVIDDKNQQLGVLETREGVAIARSKGLDLIMVADKAQPPVCRIMDYGKFKYEKSKKEKQAKKSASNELKMVRLHPRTGQHDREVLTRNAERFLRDGHKVRVVCQFKGRENAHPQIGRDQLDAVGEALKDVCTIEGTITKQGRDMIMFLVPKPGLKKLVKPSKTDLKAAKSEDKESSVSDDDDEDDELEEDEATEDDIADETDVEDDDSDEMDDDEIDEVEEADDEDEDDEDETED